MSSNLYKITVEGVEHDIDDGVLGSVLLLLHGRIFNSVYEVYLGSGLSGGLTGELRGDAGTGVGVKQYGGTAEDGEDIWAAVLGNEKGLGVQAPVWSVDKGGRESGVAIEDEDD